MANGKKLDKEELLIFIRLRQNWFYNIQISVEITLPNNLYWQTADLQRNFCIRSLLYFYNSCICMKTNVKILVIQKPIKN